MKEYLLGDIVTDDAESCIGAVILDDSPQCTLGLVSHHIGLV